MKTLILAALMAASMVSGCSHDIAAIPANECAYRPSVSVERLEDNNMVVLEVVHGFNQIESVDVASGLFNADPYPGMELSVYQIGCTCNSSTESLYSFTRDDGHWWDVEPEYGGVNCWGAWENPVAGEKFTGWFYDNGTKSDVEDDVLVFIER